VGSQYHQAVSYHSDIAAKAVIELTNAIAQEIDDTYAQALLADIRMSGKGGHLASCGISSQKVKQAKTVLKNDYPSVDMMARAVNFLDGLDHEQAVFNE
jgi:ribosomal protein L22